jgi:hypothetical protein
MSMADKSKEQEKENQVPEAKPSKMPLMVAGGILLVILIVAFKFMMAPSEVEENIAPEKTTAEYIVPTKMYQLKDGAYLKLAFSIVVDSDRVEAIQNIVEKESPGKLPAGVTMILGNKTREDLINGTHKREAFAREIKKMLEERVFSEYNNKQQSASTLIEIREILISDFVTQSG